MPFSVSVPPNETPITVALKEWSIVCKALEEGRQILLLRKGGIMEYRQGFEIRHNIFYLYPTFEHQSREFIQADYVNNLNVLLQNAPKKGKNRITSYAQATAINQVNDKIVLDKLHKYHIWNDYYVNVRMNYNPRKPMHVILLRVFKMNNPVEVDVKSEWAGCKSWIPIECLSSSSSYRQNKEQNSSNSMSGGQYPVLDDLKFNKIVAEIEEILT